MIRISDRFAATISRSTAAVKPPRPPVCTVKRQKRPNQAAENSSSAGLLASSNPGDRFHRDTSVKRAIDDAAGSGDGRKFLPIAKDAIRFTIIPSEQNESAPSRTERVMGEDLHRQRVLNMLEAFYAGDIDAAVSHCSDNVDFFSNAPIDILPHLGHHRGKDEVRQMWTSIHSRYSSMRYQLPFVVAEDDKVAVHIRAFLVKRKNDRIMQFDIATFYTLSGGRIVRIREIMDTFDLIQQVLERDLIGLLTDSGAGSIP
jgi:ketosteroid isomerase-like protein